MEEIEFPLRPTLIFKGKLLVVLFESCEIGDSWLAASFGGSLATSVPRTFEEKKEREEASPSFSPELGTRDAPIPSMSERTEWDIRPSLGSRRSALFPLIDLPQPPGGEKSYTLYFPEKDDEVKKSPRQPKRPPPSTTRYFRRKSGFFVARRKRSSKKKIHFSVAWETKKVRVFLGN